MNVETLINFGVQLGSHDANVEARHTEATQIVNDRMCCLRELRSQVQHCPERDIRLASTLESFSVSLFALRTGPATSSTRLFFFPQAKLDGSVQPATTCSLEC